MMLSFMRDLRRTVDGAAPQRRMAAGGAERHHRHLRQRRMGVDGAAHLQRMGVGGAVRQNQHLLPRLSQKGVGVPPKGVDGPRGVVVVPRGVVVVPVGVGDVNGRRKDCEKSAFGRVAK
jgi:hypothetical protein